MNQKFPNKFITIALMKMASLFSDKTYIKLLFRSEMERRLDLSDCKTMNEKLQWLKLNNRYPRMTDIVDKIKVKPIIASLIGEQYVIPTLKVWDTPEDITEADIEALPEKFVIKTNHSGGNTGVCIVRDKNKLDLKALRSKMAKSLRDDIYKYFREWPYKNVERKIFAEEYLGDDILDYKFYCFNGEADVVLLCLGRQGEGKTKFYFFDKDWNLRRYNKAGKAAPEGFTIPKPEGMDRMFEIAADLSKGFPFVRVDLYNVNGKIYFGELTFYPASGFDYNRLPEADAYFGGKIDLSIARNEVD